LAKIGAQEPKDNHITLNNSSGHWSQKGETNTRRGLRWTNEQKWGRQVQKERKKAGTKRVP